MGNAERRMQKSNFKFGLSQFALLAWATVCFYAAFYSASELWLVQMYGFSHVCSEHLHFISTPKGGDWVVSNGDKIVDGFFIHHFLVCIVLWLAITLSPFLVSNIIARFNSWRLSRRVTAYYKSKGF